MQRLADYPRRVERLRLLWADAPCEPGRSSGSRARGGLLLLRGGASGGARGASGAVPKGPLTAAQIRELMSRDITPEDYELLLLLDEGVKKAKTFSPDVASALPRAAGAAWVNEECSICLCALEEDEDVRMLPECGHCFHAPCAQRWLTSSKANCPLCGREQTKQERVLEAFRQVDQNGDGTIEAADMRRVLAALDPDTWTLEKVNRLFDAMDADRDGRINLQEFVNWVFAVDGDQQQSLRGAFDI